MVVNQSLESAEHSLTLVTLGKASCSWHLPGYTQVTVQSSWPRALSPAFSQTVVETKPKAELELRGALASHARPDSVPSRALPQIYILWG